MKTSKTLSYKEKKSPLVVRGDTIFLDQVSRVICFETCLADVVAYKLLGSLRKCLCSAHGGFFICYKICDGDCNVWKSVWKCVF